MVVCPFLALSSLADYPIRSWLKGSSLTSIRLGWKGLLGKHSRLLYLFVSGKEKKSFYDLAPGLLRVFIWWHDQPSTTTPNAIRSTWNAPPPRFPSGTNFNPLQYLQAWGTVCSSTLVGSSLLCKYHEKVFAKLSTMTKPRHSFQL